MPHKFTPDQISFIKNNIVDRSSLELAEIFNKHFNLSITSHQIRSFKKNHKLCSGVNTRFEKGNVPYNKGTKGIVLWGIETQFKKGHRPHNHLEVGTERINSDGYVDIKTAEPNKWKGKHILTWEKHNGPVPANHAIIFGDKNKRNFKTSNLLLVTRIQLLILNKKNLIQEDAELTKTGIIIADLYGKIKEF